MKLPDVFNLKQAVDNKFALKLFRSIQADALKWAAEQITTDGNPDVARDKIMRKIKDVAAMPNDQALRLEATNDTKTSE